MFFRPVGSEALPEILTWKCALYGVLLQKILDEKLCNLEDENHVLRQKALSSPKGSRPGFVKPFLEAHKDATLMVANLQRQQVYS
ncbi:hypothetical protein LOK49_LG01G00904 [Camellia lanceoleosa]|uniref:Uncharacterized protein n=1 Tax=Camellia lanceoleosa TaxID=1840588 RepID=A0ACC0IWL9_9ERIC|nr:hypothetical protein LOK49_LG01G00904 [Camellia lanceoleosa]